MDNEPRLKVLEAKVDKQQQDITLIHERQKNMHNDMIENTKAMKELTVSMNELKAFMANRKGAMWAFGFMFTVIGMLAAAGAWFWDHVLGK